MGALQLGQIVHGRRLIIVVDGWEGAGRRELLKALCAGLDPTHVRAHSLEETGWGRHGHWLAPFWSKLGRAGETSLFLHSWHEQAAHARVANLLTSKQWSRAADEINEFENTQAEHGAKIVKLFLHVTAPVQRERLQARASDPWQRWRLRDEELRGLDARDAWQAAWSTLLGETDTRWAPWTIIDANDAQTALVTGLKAVREAMTKAIPVEPPADKDNVVVLNRTA
ncbi:hypothetical protein HMF7854_10385 [Sphingomonas ginkgonis]|uniref:Polyphosphate kinase-2-related domain-containing protein n=2 Tax=Sphingomonas ginkgonis TaxID=2315330 RepID=A0A429VBH3_9SPHN|nr:hypothetical protein HMF7854_10385 [Sphingomonas ginkgonis]